MFHFTRHYFNIKPFAMLLFVASSVSSAFFISGNTLAQEASQEKRVVLATTERAPYIGTDLPNYGYVYELVTAAFKIEGYDVDIQFMPLARAQFSAVNGRVDGVLPAYYSKEDLNVYDYSDPFPGDSVGFLKKRGTHIENYHDQALSIPEKIAALKPYHIGVVRGADLHPAFDQADHLKKHYVKQDLQNIDKLALGRLDLVAIDKFTAADTLVSNRPHLIGELEFLHPALVDREFHIAFSKKKPNTLALKEAFNKGLQKLKETGKLKDIQASHGLFTMPDSAKKRRLTIGTVDNGEMIIMQKLAEAYTRKHPDVELEWRILEEDTLRQRLMSDLAINDGQFDVMTIGAYEARVWAKKGWITPLNDLPEAYQLDDVLPNVREALSSEGQLYALPFYAESSMTYYRQDLFEEANLQMPVQPTYSDIETFAAKIHQPDKGIYGICLRGKAGWGSNMAYITTLVNTFGGQWFDMQWKPKLDTNAWREALTFYERVLRLYGPPNPEDNNFNENRILFSEGKCGMWIDATVAAGMLYNPKQSKVADHLAFAPAPVAETPKGSHWLWIWALAIPDSSKNKELAMDFVTWATSQDYINLVAENEGWIAVPPGTRMSTYLSKDYQLTAPFSQFVLKAIQAADPVDSTLMPKPYIGIQYVDIHEFPALGSQVGALLSKYLEGEMNLEQALNQSQALIFRQMQKSGYYD